MARGRGVLEFLGPLPTGAAGLTWLIITFLVGVAWFKRHLDINRGRQEPVLRADEPGPQRSAAADELPSLTMLVAGKDEEANIERCARGLMAQHYPRLEIILVDDRSADRTPEIIDRLAAEDPRVTTLHVTSLPAGWFGKNHAMHMGVGRAGGEWLCFSDADCTYDSPELLAAAMRFALREGVEFLSVLPVLEAGSLWERIVQPVAGAIMVFWFPPQKVNDPRSTRAYANGAFMLMSRAAYERLGGHEPVKATLNEDMHLARRAKQLGVSLRVIRCDGLYRVRMYTGFKQIWRGWSRIFYGCFGTFPRLLVSVLMLSIFSVGPWVTVASALATGQHWFSAAGFFTILGQQTVIWRFYALTGNGAAWGLTYPVGALICLGMTLNAMTRLFGTKTTWRGTNYSGGAQTAPEPGRNP